MLFDTTCEFISTIHFYNQNKVERLDGQPELDFKTQNEIEIAECNQMDFYSRSINNKYFLFVRKNKLKH